MKTIQGTDEGPFLYAGNMNVISIREAIEAAVVARGCFLVDVTVSKDNDILITIESETGTVCLEDCEAINDVMLATFDRDVEDFSLTVSSAGLDQPFKVLRQFEKAVGTKVELSLKGGKKMVADLVAADENGISVKYSAKEAVEGSKKKQIVTHEETYTYDQVTAARPYITFE